MKKIQISNKGILVLVMLLISSLGLSQKKKIKIANKEFDRYSYIDAREIYLKVLEDGYESAEIYQNLGDTYYWNSDYDNAAKWYEKLINTFPSETQAQYYYRAALSLKSLKRYEDSDKFMNIYASMDQDQLIVKNYINDTDYLNSIALEAKSYLLEKVEINTTQHSEFGPSFYGDKIVFTSSRSNSKDSKKFEWTNQSFLDLYVADADSLGILSNAREITGDINTRYHESSTVFLKDGKTAYFTRSNYTNKRIRTDKKNTVLLKLYKASINDKGVWGNIQELPFNSDEYSVAHPALSVDEKRLYFSSDMPGTHGMSDLWYVDILGDNTYGEPKNLGENVNTEARESFPFISDQGNLYFSSDGHTGLGGYDIFTTTLDADGMPKKPTNLGEPANSAKDDFGFIIKEKKRMGYLASNREGNQGSDSDDIYRIKEICEILVIGNVFDEDTLDPIVGASVQLYDENNILLKEVLSDEEAAFRFEECGCDKQYNIKAEKELYEPNEKGFTTPNTTGTIEVPIPLKLIDPCPDNDLGCKLTLQPIYFDLDKDNIRPDAAIELAKVLAAMREYPELNIHIESHTDSRQTHEYNEELSDRRAKSTRNWLISKGIDKNRLTAKGYGETQLVNDCKNDVSSKLPNECSEEEHQLNRRSMFIIED